MTLMTVSFHSLNYPSHTFGYMNNHSISQYSVRTIPALAFPPSSVLLQSDESGNLLDSKKIPGSNTSKNFVCNSLFNQDNVVGIIGGVSIDSTLNFLKKLVQFSKKEGDDCPPFVLCSDPVLSKNENFHRDRATVENLRRKRVFLEKSGARCVVMPCHVSHSWHDEVSRGCSVPFLHMGECVARELKEANLRPVETGSPLRIGVLATDATLKAGFYQEKVQNEGFEVVVPDKATMEHTVIPATEALNRKDMEGARNLLRIALQVLLVRAVNTVILASDDMRELLPHDDPLLKKCVDPLDALARSTIKWTLSAGKDVKRRAGRPRKARRREPDEEPKETSKLGRKGIKMTCRNCGKVGHNKRGCKTVVNAGKGTSTGTEAAVNAGDGTSTATQAAVIAAVGTSTATQAAQSMVSPEAFKRRAGKGKSVK